MAKTQFSLPQDVVSQRRSQFEAQYTNRDESRGYNVGTFEYPEGLRIKPDLQHYVAFKINVRDKSSEGQRLTEKNAVFTQSSAEANRIAALRNQEANLNQNDLQKGAQNVVENLGTITAATLGVKSLFNLVKRLGAGKGLPSVGKIAVTTVGIAAAKPLIDAAADQIQKLNIPAFQFGSTSRLKDVITLHLEERPVVKYGTNYGSKDMGVLTGLITQGSAKEVLGSAEYSEGLARVLSEVAKLPSLRAGGGTLNDLRELSTRTRTNPFREVMFESVDYRSFNFRYRFFPKSQGETNKINDIIKLFKTHMHPEITSNKLFYIYPSEFQIEYYYKNEVNKYLHNFATCVLTDMQVEYGGDQFATFENGAPVEIGLTLSFRELSQMTSEGIRNNGY